MLTVCLFLGVSGVVCWGLGLTYLVSFPIFCGSGSSLLEFSLVCDSLSSLFIGVLSLIVFTILIFSGEYLGPDPLFRRFISMLFSFVMSMVILLLSSNLLFILVGWDGLGATSFLLISFYKTSVSWSSSLKTYLINRSGDAFLLVVVCLVLTKLQGSSAHWSISLLFVLGALTKSANFPFSSWLPAAMAAPTPVSALVHSSTLVTAGVFLLVRFLHLFDPNLEIILSSLGLWTVLIASVAALFESDMKKVVAYSTLSQLGVMVYCVGNHLFSLVIFHMFTHALFKANMFICSGYFLVNQSHQQDFRSLSLSPSPFLLGVSLTLATFNLKGMLFLSGFYSKDSMLDSDFGALNIFGGGIFVFSLLGTIGYSFRLVYTLASNISFTLFNSPPKFSFTPLVLSVCSMVFGGLVFGDFYLFHSSSSIFKGVPVTMLLFGSLYMVFWSFGGKSIWSSKIGGLNYFNSDFSHTSLTQLGQVSNKVLEKGLLSPSHFITTSGYNITSNSLILEFWPSFMVCLLVSLLFLFFI